MTKHTPGPWAYGPNPKGQLSNEFVVRPAGEFPHGEWIADCGHGEQGEANARLISAAPRMLEALKAFVEEFDDTYDASREPGEENYRGGCDISVTAYEKARQAIKGLE